MSKRADALAERLELGAARLAEVARVLTESQWQAGIPRDGRKVGVVVHHVASMYQLEIQLAQIIAAGRPITGVSRAVINEMNVEHAREFDAVTKVAALDLLRRNSAAAAAAIRALSDEELDRAVPVSLYGGAPLTCQFMLEDHAVRHSFHHLVRLYWAVQPQSSVAA